MKRVRKRAETAPTTPVPTIPVKPPPRRKSPAVVPVLPKEPETLTTSGAASALLNPPIGVIQTLNPKGTSFGINWAQINQYDRLIVAAADEFRVPFARLKAPIVIESGGKPDAVQRNPKNGDSIGLLQIVPIGNGWSGWQDRIKELAPELARVVGVVNALIDPAINLRVGASILRDFYDQHGSWDAANSAFFTGTPNWQGADSVNGTRGGDYKRSLDGLLSEIWTADAGASPETPDGGSLSPGDRWRPYPYPKMVDLIVAKPAEGAGFDRVPFRRPNIRGFATHITDGEASIEWYSEFFGTGGERAWDALTDLVIGRDGRIGLLNDWRDANRGGTRAGWANGGVDGLEGEGVAFYRKFPNINVALVSAEHVARAGQSWSDVMLASSIEVRTAIAQELKCPWSAYPFHPGYGGVSIEQQHRNFATKACPANPYISTYDAVVRREVKAKLKAWQGGDAGELAPVPDPVWYTRFGFSLEQISDFFGTIIRENPDGTTDEFGFDVNGGVSLFWLERCDREGQFPEAERIWTSDAQFVDGKEMYCSFEGGWVGFLALADSRASWVWLDETVDQG